MTTPQLTVPVAGDDGQFLRYNSGAGTATWETPAGGGGAVTSTVADVFVTGLVANDQTAAAANTAAIQTAIQTAHDAPAGMSALTGGGAPRGSKVVRLPPGNFYVQRNADVGAWYAISVLDHVTLRGCGWGTRLTLKSGVITTTDESTACSVIWFSNPSSFAGVEDLMVDGNWAGQTATNEWSHGIDMRRNDVTAMYDGGLWADHVMAWGCCGSGIMAGYAGGTRGESSANTATLLNCYAYHNRTHGFHLKTDQRVVGCKAGNNVNSGFRVYASTSCLIANCKGFGNRRDLDISYSEQVIVDNFTSEDFKGEAGIALTATRHSRVTGGIYRCMTTNPGGYNAGLWVEDDGANAVDPWHTSRCNGLDIQLVCSFPTSTGAVIYPQKHLITRHVGAAVSINMRAQPGTWTAERWQNLGGSTDADIRFNNSNAGVVTVAYAAAVTPVPDNGEMHIVGALTGGITVNNPTYPYKGQRVGFRFVQDAVGGRTVTWGSAFRPAGWTIDGTASAYSSVTFVYDGAVWVRTSG